MQDAKVCYICHKMFIQKVSKDKNHPKVRKHCLYTGNYWGVAFNASHEILVVFHYGANYNYHLMIKQLTNEF